MSDTEISQKLESTKIEGQEPSTEETFDLSSMKKKKKKSKKVGFDDAVAVEGDDAANMSGTEAGDEDAFAELKKKKKSKTKTVSFDDLDGDAADGDADMFDLSSMKKKKKKSKKNLAAFEAELGDDGADNEESSTAKAGEPWIGTDRDYTYEELLTRFYQVLRENNPDLAGEKRKYTIVPPQVVRDGNKRSVFANLNDICKRMHRPPEHVIQFLFAELGTSGSIDGSGRLVIKGRFQQKQIENVLRRYIVEYVTCKSCKSGETVLTKESRLYYIQCESCGSTRSVAPIKTGFQAQTTKRSVARRAVAA